MNLSKPYNPGALMKSSVNYQGKVPHSINKTGRLEKFISLPWGTRAMILNIISKIRNPGTNTLRKLMAVYAPAHENNTAAYVQQLAQKLGISADQKLTEEKELLKKLVIAISEKEGIHPLTAQDFEEGLAHINKTIEVKAITITGK